MVDLHLPPKVRPSLVMSSPSHCPIVWLGQLLLLSEPQFLICTMGTSTNIYLIWLLLKWDRKKSWKAFSTELGTQLVIYKCSLALLLMGEERLDHKTIELYLGERSVHPHHSPDCRHSWHYGTHSSSITREERKIILIFQMWKLEALEVTYPGPPSK